MKKYILILILFSATNIWAQKFKCLYSYENQYKNLKDGIPKDSSLFYFPIKRFVDSLPGFISKGNRKAFYFGASTKMTVSESEHVPVSQVIDSFRVSTDTFKLKWFSYYLFKMKEPILYDHYLGKDIYRLTWLRSFNPPVTITLEKGQSTYLISKMLNRNPRLPFIRYLRLDENGNKILDRDTVMTKVKILKQELVTRGFVDKVENLLLKYKIDCSSPLGRSDIGVDGSEWIIEIHKKEGYHFMVRWTPEEKEGIRKLGELLIKKSALSKEEKY